METISSVTIQVTISVDPETVTPRMKDCHDAVLFVGEIYYEVVDIKVPEAVGA